MAQSVTKKLKRLQGLQRLESILHSRIALDNMRRRKPIINPHSMGASNQRNLEKDTRRVLKLARRQQKKLPYPNSRGVGK